MFKTLPKIGKTLSKDHIDFLKIFTKSCRNSILQMVTNAESGHPGGSLSSIDYLATIYAYILSQTGEKIVISNGHISPAVYSVLAELNYISKPDVIKNFRKFGSKYEGHVSRHVNGIFYGTGPLGVGGSVASGFAVAEKIKKSKKKVFALMGDGETQEGQVHEMIHFCKHNALDNFILFIDFNKVQLTASLKEVLDIDIKKTFQAGDWHIIDVNGHNFPKMWDALSEAYTVKGKPVVILGHTIMGKGVNFMEKDGSELKSIWHGRPPTKEETKKVIKSLTLTEKEKNLLKKFQKFIKWKPKKNLFPKLLSKVAIKTGTPILYGKDDSIDCRTAYGKALLDLANHNKEILVLSADVKSSVMTKFVSEELPKQYIECGIAEQHMVSTAGGLSFYDFVPFTSTFGAFMSSRAKDQARVNDINHSNVKMVSTHCGLSVGEDGPTHQAIDDAGSYLGMFNTMVVEPADPNQTDRIIRYIASHYGNFYMRMGRHKFPIITKEDNSIFYDDKYEYKYGKCDLLRKGNKITIAAIGTMVNHIIQAQDILKKSNPKLAKEIEIIAVTSIKAFDETLIKSIKKTKNLITIEDHNPYSGLGGQLAKYLSQNGICTNKFQMLGVNNYQLSGKPEELYKQAGLSPEKIANTIKNF